MNKLLIATLSIGLSSILFANNIESTNLIKNGGFETIKKEGRLFYPTDWSSEGSKFRTLRQNAKIAPVEKYGRWCAFNTGFKRILDSMSQYVQTEVDEKYLLTFELKGYGQAKYDTINVIVDGEIVLRATLKAPHKWETFMVELTGTGDEQKITFQESNVYTNVALDNISLTKGTMADYESIQAQKLQKSNIVNISGIDQITNIIASSNAPASTLENANKSAQEMNRLIKKAITELGLANDGEITVSDSLEIKDYLTRNYKTLWRQLYRDYSKIMKNSNVQALGTYNAVSDVWGSIYGLGLDKKVAHHKACCGHSGGAAAAAASTAYFLNESLIMDLDSLKNETYKEVSGTTGTQLDKIIGIILKDKGLLANIKTSDLRAGAMSADVMNSYIIEGIRAEGLANDGKLTTADIRTLNQYILKNHGSEWIGLHGDDENGKETGYHRIQSDGATSRMFADNFMNSIADGIYHIGFKSRFKDNLVNEDNQKNKTYEQVASWLDSLLKPDLVAGNLNNPDYHEVESTTGSYIDKIIGNIYNDEGLIQNVSMEDIRVASESASEMNSLIKEAIEETGVMSDCYITPNEAKRINKYLVENHGSRWIALHGNDTNNGHHKSGCCGHGGGGAAAAAAATGYHRIQNEGATSVLNNQNIINTLADNIYHIGFRTKYPNNLVNEDGAKNASFETVAFWLNKAFKKECTNGA